MDVGAFARKKCPCCNNPWNESSDESVSSASINRFSCGPCLKDDKGYSGLDPSNIGKIRIAFLHDLINIFNTMTVHF